jgi:hypothetical protein
MPEWRAVVGFEGFYEVSNEGQVRRIKPAKRARVGQILKPYPNSRNGRLMVCLSVNSRQKTALVATLVANAFLGQRPDGLDINHIDYDCHNNRADNLEYVTRSENLRHAYANGFVGGIGEAQHLSKLTVYDIGLIRKSPLGHTALALHYRVTRQTIQDVRRVKTWKSVD